MDRPAAVCVGRVPPRAKKCALPLGPSPTHSPTHVPFRLPLCAEHVPRYATERADMMATIAALATSMVASAVAATIAIAAAAIRLQACHHHRHRHNFAAPPLPLIATASPQTPRRNRLPLPPLPPPPLPPPPPPYSLPRHRSRHHRHRHHATGSGTADGGATSRGATASVAPVRAPLRTPPAGCGCGRSGRARLQGALGSRTPREHADSAASVSATAGRLGYGRLGPYPLGRRVHCSCCSRAAGTVRRGPSWTARTVGGSAAGGRAASVRVLLHHSISCIDACVHACVCVHMRCNDRDFS